MAVKKPTAAKPVEKKATAVKKESSSWIGEIEKYSRQIWLAGLGAYSKVSKDGAKLFDGLVKDGEKAEKEAKTEAGKQAGAVKSSVGSAKLKVDEVKGKALGKWGELEEAFDKRLNNAISRLGVPSRNEVKSLEGKVDALTRQIEKLTGLSAEPAPKAAAKTAAKATTAKPVAKAAPKAAAKPAAKPAAKTAAAKPAPKPAAKPAAVKAAAKPATKAAAKPAAKAAPKAAAKPASKPAVKKPASKPAAKPAAAKPAASATSTATATAAPAATVAATPSAAGSPSTQS
ncbi:phasin family protein [Pseudomonas sp. LRF_L74]|uniref:phasin family protein n=1 Tax=Pseudomonas sp. LRF_L74 TaxID=3369422 RepID=UPI003F5E71A0